MKSFSNPMKSLWIQHETPMTSLWNPYELRTPFEIPMKFSRNPHEIPMKSLYIHHLWPPKMCLPQAPLGTFALSCFLAVATGTEPGAARFDAGSNVGEICGWPNILPIYAPWCWNIYLHDWVISGVNVGKYDSTREHLAWGWVDNPREI